MAKKSLPDPQRSQFDQTELLKRIAELEERVEKLEVKTRYNTNTLIGTNVPVMGSGRRI